jgi:hypothetical protein
MDDMGRSKELKRCITHSHIYDYLTCVATDLMFMAGGNLRHLFQFSLQTREEFKTKNGNRGSKS